MKRGTERVRARRYLPALAMVVALGSAGVVYADPYVPPPVVPAPPVAPGAAHVAPAFRHEVWALDQSNTAATVLGGPLTHGGRIHIYDAGDLRRLGEGAPAEVVELAGATTTLCLAETGVRPARPHMAAMTRSGSHAIVSFVATGHVVIFDASTRAPLACFRTEIGTTGPARQAHAAVLTPDERFLLVANQNGKKVERISVDFTTGEFVQEPAATIDLATGTTPNGAPRQAPGIRPDNAPICAFVPSSGFPAYVSLRGGGMLALDPYTTPMQIVAEYDVDTIAGDGCGFAEGDGWVVGNGGSNASKPNGWFVYRMPVGGRELYDASNPPNTPPIDLLDVDPTGPRDSHGGAVTGGGKYVWVFDRIAHVAEVFEMKTGDKVNTLNLRSRFSDQPAVDIAAVSPDGRYLYATTRGPLPQSGAHAATGTNPGVIVIELLQDGRTGAVRQLAPISNMVQTPTALTETADPHGIIVRTTSRPAPRATPFQRRVIAAAAPTADAPSLFCQI